MGALRFRPRLGDLPTPQPPTLALPMMNHEPACLGGSVGLVSHRRMQARVRFLVNPTAGGGRARRVLGRVRSRAEAVGAAVELSADGSDLTARARRAVHDGVQRLVVVGGDGTAHLAIQALARTACELAVVPTGRGDDFACSLGIPTEPGAALELALTGTAREIDLVRVDRPGAGPMWGGVYASAGFDSAVTRTGNAQPRWIPSSVTYIVAALRTLAGFEAPLITVEHDGGLYEEPSMFVAACNAPRYGRGMRIAPNASMTDGLLDVVTVARISKLELLRIFPRVFSGRHVDHPAVSIFRSRRARVRVEPAVLLGSDGEIEGEVGSDPVEITAVARALRAVAADSAAI